MSWRRNTDPEFDEAELRALLQLRMLPGLTDQRLKSLLSRHNPTAILENAGPHEIGERAWHARGEPAIKERVQRAVRMIERLAVDVITIRSGRYPQRLVPLEEFAPPILFCRGRTELLQAHGLAIIGARDSTEYGDSVTEMLAADLAARGVTIISGLARGIDAIAHRSALDAGGTTVAVLGCGIDVDYPPRNAALQRRIAEEGLLISEFAPGAPAYRANFPQRNRLIALLGSGVLVIEAGPRSGTRKTVDWALGYGIPVLAVPGPIGRYESQGTNEIIQDGGRLVISTRDVLEELGWADRLAAQPAFDDGASVAMESSAQRVYQELTLAGLHVDAIARRCGLSAPETLAELLHLELEGLAQQYAGKRFARTPVRTKAGAATPAK